MFDPYMVEFPDVQDQIDLIALISGGHFGCGFRTQEQLRRWFTDDELKKLHSFDYRIVIIIPDKVLAESANQLVFWCKQPLKRIAHNVEVKHYV